MVNLSVFVAGVHGSGKSTLCDEVGPRIGAPCVTASSLIKRAKSMGSGKAVSDVADNQAILISEFRNLSKANTRIILDGHFCLLNQEGEIEELPADVFRLLSIKKIVVVTAEPQVIYERLLARDGSTHGLEVSAIEEFQRAELKNARDVSDELGLPLIEVDSSDGRGAIDAVVEFLTVGDR